MAAVKRTPLHRRTPLKAHKRNGWNSTLRPQSEKKRMEQRETNPVRRAYVASARKCEWFDCDEPARDCHEIAAGSHRHRSLRDPRCLLALCRSCHEKAQGAPFALQYAAKVLVSEGSEAAADGIRDGINEALGRCEL